MTTINLIQGDSDKIKARVIHSGVPVNLQGYSVTFNMENDAGEVISINCINGFIDRSTDPQTVYSETDGYLTIPFTATDTANVCTYIGQFHVMLDNEKKSWPLASYVTVKIWDYIGW